MCLGKSELSHNQLISFVVELDPTKMFVVAILYASGLLRSCLTQVAKTFERKTCLGSLLSAGNASHDALAVADMGKLPE